jgi:hypothetical protein
LELELSLDFKASWPNFSFGSVRFHSSSFTNDEE